MSLEEMLRKWNGGVVRGAKKRLAARIGVNRVTVSKWFSGDQVPGEAMRPNLAKELGVSLYELLTALQGITKGQGPIVREDSPTYSAPGQIRLFLSEDEMGMLKQACQRDTRSPLDEIRWLIRSYADGTISVQSHEKHADIKVSHPHRGRQQPPGNQATGS